MTVSYVIRVNPRNPWILKKRSTTPSRGRFPSQTHFKGRGTKLSLESLATDQDPAGRAPGCEACAAAFIWATCVAVAAIASGGRVWLGCKRGSGPSGAFGPHPARAASPRQATTNRRTVPLREDRRRGTGLVAITASRSTCCSAPGWWDRDRFHTESCPWRGHRKTES